MKRHSVHRAGLALLAGLAVTVTGCSSSSPATLSGTASPSAVNTLTVVSGPASIKLQITDGSCTSQLDGAAGWEISGHGVSSSSGQTEPWSLTEYPNVSPPELRLQLPDGTQYESSSEDAGAPAGLTVTSTSISLNNVPLYDNGDPTAAKITVAATVPCSRG